MNKTIGFFHEGEPGSSRAATMDEAAIFTHPEQVVSDPRLTAAERKALLASWCSDARAVENAPRLRRLDSGAVVEIDEILRALRSLDEPGTGARQRRGSADSRPSRRVKLSRWLSRAGSPRRSNDNDDDPPPAPAGFGMPFRPTFVAAHGAAPGGLLAFARAAA